MGRTKYIVGTLKNSSCVSCLIFEEMVNHSDMACNFKNVLGAGFVFIVNGDYSPEVSVYGESISLGVKSRDEDVGVIKRTLGLPTNGG